MQFKVGDRVIRTTASVRTVVKGGIYTVREQRVPYVVRLDGHQGEYDAMNFALATFPSSGEVEHALAILKAAGDVSFTPRKPPFTPIRIQVGSYEAIITEKEVKVGCTVVPFSKVVDIMDACAKAQEYNAS